MLSELEYSGRIDAEYYRPKFLKYETIVKNRDGKSLKDVTNFLIGPFGSAFTVDNYVDDKSYRYIRGKDVKPLKLMDDDNVYMPFEDYKKLSKYALKENDILVSVVGTLGNAAIITKKDIPAIFSCKSTVLRVNKINPNYLLVYLNSKYGRELLLRKERGAIQKGLNLDDLKTLEVFVPSENFQNQIDNFFKLSFQNLEQSKLLYIQAENLLLESLGLNKESLDCQEAKAYLNSDVGDLEKKPATSSLRGVATPRRGNPELQNQKSDKFSHLSINQKSFKESFLKTGRLDAEYYQPKYEEITNQIKLREYAKLSDLVLIQKSIEPGSEAYLENGLEFIRVANLNKFGISKSEIFLDEEKYSGTIKPKKDTILLSKDGTVGIAYKVSEDLNCITSGAILHLTINQKNILPDYLTLVLNSKLVQMQAERDSGGSIIQHWKPSEIMEILIPIIDQPTQAKISSLIQTSFTLKAKSENLLEVAKKAVEMAIEENEERALEFIAKMK